MQGANITAATAGPLRRRPVGTVLARLCVPDAAEDRGRWVSCVAQVPALHHNALDVGTATPQRISCALIHATILNKSLYFLLKSSGSSSHLPKLVPCTSRLWCTMVSAATASTATSV